VSKLFSAHPELANQAGSIHACIIATQTPRAKLLYTPVPANMSPLDQHFIDYGLFFGFLVNPFNDRLGGPCANCGQHFVKNTKRRKTRYCSPRCGKLCTSRLANQNRRRSERRRQLRDVRWAIQEWRKGKCKLVWKEWVSRRTQVSKIGLREQSSRVIFRNRGRRDLEFPRWGSPTPSLRLDLQVEN
jgi:hypothetical protein